MRKAEELDTPVMAKIVSTATMGVDSDITGIGRVSSSKKALQKAGMNLNDMELIEINEAFVPQYVACEKVMGL